MNSEALFAGIDVSTQGCKLLILDTKIEEVVYVDSLNYDQDLPHYHTQDGTLTALKDGCSESDPHMWIEAIEVLFKRLKESKINQKYILCISVSGQQHGLVALDSQGNLTRKTSKLWNDFSTSKECELLTQAVGGKKTMIQEVGNSQKTGYTAPKILHMLRHEPENYQRTDVFLVVHNYINWYLTGGVKVMEPGDTSGTALWNPKDKKWSQKVIQAIDPSLENKLPPVRSSCRSIGLIASSLVKKHGFSPQCKIDAGSGDNMYGAVGTGNINPSILSISLGTSGTAFTILKDPYIDPSGDIACYCDSTGNYLPLLCVSNLSNGYNTLLKKYKISHQEFTQTVNHTKPGNQGRILIPWYVGERTPDLPLASPLYFGFKLDDFNKNILCRAVLEGHILNLYQGFKRMPVKTKQIRLTGGLSQSDAWRQAIADIFEAETIPVLGEGAALGAAIHAAWVWGKEEGKKQTLEQLTSTFVKLDLQAKKKPNPDAIPLYRLQKRLFQALVQRIRGKKGEDPFALQHRLKSQSI
ncbi:MAG: xylulokinase [Acidobacteriota bacterium]